MDDLLKFDNLCDDLADKKIQIKAHEAEKKRISGEVRGLEEQIITYLESLSKTKHNTARGLFYIKTRSTYATPKDPESREAFFNYLKSREVFDDLISVNSSTLNAFAKQELDIAIENGDDDFEMPGLGDPHMQQSIVFKKG